MTKVLFVSPLGSRLVGGIAKWTENILDYYKTLTATNVILDHCYTDNAEEVFGGDNLWIRLKKGVRNYLPLLRKVRRRLKREHYDTLHICTSASLGIVKDLIMTDYARCRNTKVVVHFHFGRIPEMFKSKGWERKLLERLIKRADEVIVMDNASLITLHGHGFKNVSYIPNPLSLETRRLIEKHEDTERVFGKIVFVGHVVENKGVMELAMATKDIDGIQVEYVGQIPDSVFGGRFRSATSKSKCKLLGSLPYEEVIKEMLSASVFVLPTYTEGFPNVIIESMACACPIITCPVGAIPEMLNIKSSNPCGICVPPKHVEELRMAILFLLKNPDKAAEMGRQARRRVYSEYSVEKVWNMLVAAWG